MQDAILDGTAGNIFTLAASEQTKPSEAAKQIGSGNSPHNVLVFVSYNKHVKMSVDSFCNS